jgi:hypothetical protein
MPRRMVYFRKKAAEAEKGAQQATDPRERKKLLALARVWTKIAEQAERLLAETGGSQGSKGPRRSPAED